MSSCKRRYEQVQPQLQRDIVEDYRRGVRGHGYFAIAQKHGLPVRTVQHVVARGLRRDGDPVAPRGHKKQKLSGDDQTKLYRTLDQNHFATNRELRAVVEDKIAECTVSRYLAHAKPCFTTKVVQDQEPEELSDEWKTATRGVVGGRQEDSTAQANLSRRTHPSMRTKRRKEVVRARANPFFEVRKRYAKKYTLHLYAKRDGVLHWDLSTKNADTTEVERVAVDAAGTMESGDTLIWDRLGRSGRSQHPTAQHYSPNAKATLKERGVTIKFLPPKGKYFNPLELLFNDLKTHYIRPKFRKNGVPLSKSEIEELVRAYVEEKAPATLRGFFRARANGADALKKQIL
jgi:hypothetical protein